MRAQPVGLTDVLQHLDSAGPELSAMRLSGACSCLQRAEELVGRVGLDCCDRMILGKVLDRLRHKAGLRSRVPEPGAGPPPPREGWCGLLVHLSRMEARVGSPFPARPDERGAPTAG